MGGCMEGNKGPTFLQLSEFKRFPPADFASDSNLLFSGSPELSRLRLPAGPAVHLRTARNILELRLVLLFQTVTPSYRALQETHHSLYKEL